MSKALRTIVIALVVAGSCTNWYFVRALLGATTPQCETPTLSPGAVDGTVGGAVTVSSKVTPATGDTGEGGGCGCSGGGGGSIQSIALVSVVATVYEHYVASQPQSGLTTQVRPNPITLQNVSGNIWRGTFTVQAGTDAGTYQVVVAAIDEAGNKCNSAPASLEVSGENGAPVISNFTLNPATLRFPGGKITVSAEVSDDKGLTRVWAVVTKMDQSTEEIELTNTFGQTFAATWTVPANTRTDGQSQTYTIHIHAKDTADQERQSDPQSLTVQAMNPPPTPPSLE